MLLLVLLLLQDGWRAEEVGEGVVWKTRRWESLYGAPQSAGVLDCDPATSRVRFAASEKALEKTSAIAARTRAVAAVNGGYFAKDGAPLGILRIDGVLISPATDGRGAVGIDERGAFFFKRLPGGNGWPEMRHAMGGVPILLEDGAVPEMERERAAHLQARHPRTAIGTTAAGRVLLVVVDGRRSDAAGMSCAELADFVRTLGCAWALNLDGGGSTTLWVRGPGVVNAPSDVTGERPVANGVTVTAKDVVMGGAGTRWRLKVEFEGEYEVTARNPTGRWKVAGEEVEPVGGSLGRWRLKPGTLEVEGGSAEALRLAEK